MKITSYLFSAFFLFLPITILKGMEEAVNAIRNKNANYLQALINSGKIHDINQPIPPELLPEKAGIPPSYETLLHFAITQQSDIMVDILLKAGANPNKADTWGGTSMHNAAYQGINNVVSKKKMYNKSDQKIAILQKIVKNILYNLLDHGGNPNSLDDFGKSPIHVAAQKAKDYSAMPKLFFVLVAHGGDPFKKDPTDKMVINYLNDEEKYAFLQKPGTVFKYIYPKTLKGKTALALLKKYDYNLYPTNFLIAQVTSDMEYFEQMKALNHSRCSAEEKILYSLHYFRNFVRN